MGLFVIGYAAPTICGGSLLKGKRYKGHRQKNIHNKAIQTKIHLYINKYIVKNITNVQNIVRQIFVCVWAVIISVYASRLNINNVP